MALMNAADERTYLVATIKQWNIDEFARRIPDLPGRWMLITDPASLDLDLVRCLEPRFVFFPPLVVEGAG